MFRRIYCGGILLLLPVSCGPGGGEGPPLWLLGFSQAERQGVGLNEELYFHFSAPLDRASVNHSTVRITDLGGTQVQGEFLTQDPEMVIFVPDLPTARDLSDGGFRPATRYQVSLAGFPRVDGLRSSTGEILSQSLVFWFETASPREGEALFLGFPGGQPRFDLDFEAHGHRSELGTLDPIRLAVKEAIDPSTLHTEDFHLSTEAYREIELDVEIVENRRDRAVIELRPISDAPGVGGRSALEPGDYLLVCEGEDGGDIRLKTLGGAPVVAAWHPKHRTLRVRDQLGQRRIDFTQKDLFWSGRPEESDATACWGGASGGVSIRYPGVAGDGSEGIVEFGRKPDRWQGRPRPGASGSVGDGGAVIDLSSRDLDVHASQLSVPDGTTVNLVGAGGWVFLRSQGTLVIRGRLARKNDGGPPPEERDAAGVRPNEELQGLSRRPPEEWPALSDWLNAAARDSREPWTVLIAGGELEVFGTVEVEGSLVMIAGGEVRLHGSVQADHKWQSQNSTSLPLREGVKPLPLRIDPPRKNPLVAPVRYSVQSKFFGIPGGVSSWGSASFEGSEGQGDWQVWFFGKRLRDGVLESFGRVANLTSLGNCREVCFRVDLEVRPAPDEPWDPPRLDSLTLSWSEPARSSGLR